MTACASSTGISLARSRTAVHCSGPSPAVNLDQVKLMFEESGAFIFGRRTYDITNGWGGAHPVNGVPVFVLTHTPPPHDSVPKGSSNLTFVTDGIASAIRQARAVGRRQGHQAWRCVARPAGARGWSLRRDPDPSCALPARRRRPAARSLRRPGQLEKISATDGPLATHLRYRVLKE